MLNCREFTPEFLDSLLTSPCGVCGAKRGADTGFSPSNSVFPFLSNIPPMLLNHFILGLLLSEGRPGKAFAVLNKTVLLDVGKTWPENYFNILKPNDIYICRTAALTSRRYILNIYSTNILTEYFKHAA